MQKGFVYSSIFNYRALVVRYLRIHFYIHCWTVLDFLVALFILLYKTCICKKKIFVLWFYKGFLFSLYLHELVRHVALADYRDYVEKTFKRWKVMTEGSHDSRSLFWWQLSRGPRRFIRSAWSNIKEHQAED